MRHCRLANALYVCGAGCLLLAGFVWRQSRRTDAPVFGAPPRSAAAVTLYSGVPANLGHIIYPRIINRGGDSVSQDVHRSTTDEEFLCTYRLPTDSKDTLINLKPARSAIFDEAVVQELSEPNATSFLPRSACRAFDAQLVGRVFDAGVMSVCANGAVVGTLVVNDEVFFIEPLRADDGQSTAHLLYRQTARHRLFDTAADVDWARAEGVGTERQARRRSKRMTRSDEYYVETLVVTDVKMSEYHAANLQDYVLTLFATVASIYRHQTLRAAMNILPVRIVELKDERRGPVITDSAQDTLKQFCRWQQQLNSADESDIGHYDVAILLTRQNICRSPGKCDTLGLAELGTMCDQYRSCAIIEDNGLSAAFTIAHELGHIFNIPHDDEAKCGEYMAPGLQNYNIMAPTLEINSQPWSWSPCSAATLQQFLESDRSHCLTNRPTQQRHWDRMFKDPSSPGLLFNADSQCQLVFGPNAKLCPYMPVCKRLWCATHYGYQVGCRTQHMPWADGTPCAARGKWCYKGACVGRAPQQMTAVDGSWGEWRGYGDCSRTCGGGITRAHRDCNNPPPQNGGRYCVGKRVQHRSCNLQDCPWDQPSFRAQQCSSFDNQNVGIHGVSLNVGWVPKYAGIGASDRCKLFCRIKGTSAFYMLKNKVVDGTECDRYGSDVCVDGRCVPAGCDHVLGSATARDGCGVCAGDGSSCRRVNGSFNEIRQFGYNFVLRIPAGANYIDIRQRAWNDHYEDHNYLALRDSNDNFILNGAYQVSVFRQMIPLVGTVLEYSGSDAIVERINSSRPTRQDLYLNILAVGDVYPPNIHYEYVLVDDAPVRATGRKYYWQRVDRWTACSAACNGVQRRVDECIDSERNVEVADHHCALLTALEQQERPCNIHCGLTWETEPASECSVACGVGERRQRSFCQMRVGEAVQRVNDSMCVGRERPAERVVCHRDCEGRRWHYGEWSSCSATCDGGAATRSAFCAAASGQRLADSECSELPREATSTLCNGTPCPRWMYDDWMECSKSCDGGVQIRYASCQDVAGEILDESQCDQANKIGRRECNSEECIMWHFGAWSECSVTCGEGSSMRKATCVNSRGDELESSRCNKQLRIDSKPCRLDRCPTWQTSEWSDCSQSCGSGWRSRRVDCADASGAHVDDGQCAAASSDGLEPPRHEPCDFGQCPFWRPREWSACTLSCGSGTKHREVECVYGVEVVDAGYCHNAVEPPRLADCHLLDCPEWQIEPWGECTKAPCPTTTTTTATMAITTTTTQLPAVLSSTSTNSARTEKHPVRWVTGGWTTCVLTCGSEERKRQVACRDPFARLLPDIYCSHSPKPDELKSCGHPSCSGRWIAEPWAPCDRTCGSATSKRVVRCDAADDSTVACDIALRPVAEKQCQLAACPDDAVPASPEAESAWSTGTWTECSRTCGLGWRSRAVVCVGGSASCPSTTKPWAIEWCRDSACDRWLVGDWRQCSRSCGGGEQTRRVVCVAADSKRPVDLRRCSESAPPSQRHCNTQPCSTLGRPLWIWRAGRWSTCSTTCGKGHRSRAVECVTIADGKRVADTSCDAAAKPPSVHRCRRARCPRWKRAPWSACSTTCGNGVRSRDVSCYRGRRFKTAATECSRLPKPQETRRCQSQPCPNYYWRTDEWPECPAELCQATTQRRLVECWSSRQQKAPSRMCDASTEPLSSRECVGSDCPFEWVPTAWSTCSRSCGVGTQERRLDCRRIKANDTEASGVLVPSEQCSALRPPRTSRPCSSASCDADSYWGADAWSHCSTTCGEGVQRRSLRCYRRDGTRLHAKHCNETTRPARRRRCFVRNCEPRDCNDVKQMNASAVDGTYSVVVSGFYVQVYCHQMNGTRPSSFISVNRRQNYAEIYGKRLLYPFTCPHNGRRNDSCLCADDGNPKAGRTEFDKVRVDLRNMKININDYTFSRQVYGERVPFGAAGDCYSAVNCPQGSFNMDLRGSGVRVSQSVSWTEHGHRTWSHIERGQKGAVVSGRCGGYCGQCYPDKWTGLLIEILRP